jgi:hypothetical protein
MSCSEAMLLSPSAFFWRKNSYIGISSRAWVQQRTCLLMDPALMQAPTMQVNMCPMFDEIKQKVVIMRDGRSEDDVKSSHLTSRIHPLSGRPAARPWQNLRLVFLTSGALSCPLPLSSFFHRNTFPLCASKKQHKHLHHDSGLQGPKGGLGVVPRRRRDVGDQLCHVRGSRTTP